MSIRRTTFAVDCRRGLCSHHASAPGRRLLLEPLEQRITLAANVIESFPTLVGEPTTWGGSQLGLANAIDGNWAVVGAPNEDAPDRPGAGAAHIYHKSDGHWTRYATLRAANAQTGDLFGYSVDIDGETIVVGAENASGLHAQSGAVYVFHLVGAQWSQQSVLYASASQEDGNFGRSLSLDGVTLVVGAPNRYSASAYVFERSGSQWSEVARLADYAPDYQWDSSFGGSVSASGNVIVVGAAGQNFTGEQSGAAHVYKRTAGSWSRAATLTRPAAEQKVGFGAAVVVQGETILVSQPTSTRYDNLGDNVGKVYVYRAAGNAWSLVQSLGPQPGASFQYFGGSLSIDGDALVVGGVGNSYYNVPGKAYLFQRGVDGLWSQSTEWQDISSGYSGTFGFAVAIDGGNIFVSENNIDDLGNALGATHTYEIASADKELSLLNVAPLRSDRVKVDYAVQGSLASVRFNVYRSADPLLDAGDLPHGVTQSDVASPAGSATAWLASYEFDPGAYDAARPYLIVSASTAGVEHRDGDNWLALRQTPALYGRQEFPMPTHGIAADGREIEFDLMLARDGDRAVVAASQFSAADGVAFVLERTGERWVQTAHLVMRDAAGNLVRGRALAIAVDDNIIAIGVPADSERGISSGAVYVYELVEGSWVQQAKLTVANPMAREEFGRSLALDGGTLAVGSYGAKLTDDVFSPRLGPSGVSFFEKQNGAWAQTARVEDIAGSTQFGAKIELAGDNLVISDPSGRDSRDWSTGAVFLYQRTESGWIKRDRVVSPDNAAPRLQDAKVAGLGMGMDLDGDEVAVAAVERGDGWMAMAYVYRIVGQRLQLEGRMKGKGIGEAYNATISGIELEDGVVALGAPFEATEKGIIYLFQKQLDGSWIEHLPVLSPVRSTNERFGYSFALDSAELLALAPFIVPSNMNAGELRRFELTGVNADVQVYNLKHVTSQTMSVSYAVQGLASAFQLTVYRSTDATLSPDDLAHVQHAANVAPTDALGTIEFAAGAYDPQRPYFIAVATPAGLDSSAANNVVALQRVAPSFAIEQLPLLLANEAEYTGGETFGYAVAIDGDQAVIGVPMDPPSADRLGEVYVMQRTNGRWTTKVVLAAPEDSPERFGQAVAIEDGVIVVGAPGPEDLPHAGGAAFVYRDTGSGWSLEQTLRPSDARANYCFGASVFIDEGTVVIGAFNNYVGSFEHGRAIYVFERGGSAWSETARFQGPSSGSHANFGYRMDVNGGTIVTSSIRESLSGTVVGTVSVFRRRNGVWEAAGEAPAPAPYFMAYFGGGVGIDGDALVVTGRRGSYSYGDLTWSIFLYDRDGESWKLRQEISTPYALTEAVALDGDTAMIGATFEGNRYGAFLLKRDAAGNWLEHGKLLTPSEDEQFAYRYSSPHSLAVSGDTLLFGTPRRDALAVNSGAVTVYEISREAADLDLFSMRHPASNEVVVDYSAVGLTQAASLAIYRSADAEFDESDLLNPVGTYLLPAVAGPASISVSPGAFDPQHPYLVAVATTTAPEHSTVNNVIAVRQRTPLELTIEQELPSLTGLGTPYYESVIAVDGDWAIVGAPSDSTVGNLAGAAYVLRRAGDRWVVETRLIAPAGTPLETRFGASVAIDGNTLVVGARQDSQVGTYAGAAYVYAFDGTSWVLQTKLLGRSSMDLFGSAVAVEDGIVVVGARGAGYFHSYDGLAFVYEMKDGAWTQTARLIGSRGDHQYSHGFGATLAMSDARLAVGSDDGKIYMYERTATEWAPTQNLLSPEGRYGDRFGESFDLSGTTLVVGAPGVDAIAAGASTTQDYGAAYVFEIVDGRWQFQQRLYRSTSLTSARFGTSVSIERDTIAVRSVSDADSLVRGGSVSIYRRRNDRQWVREEKLVDGSMATRDYLFGPIAVGEGVLLAGGFTADYVPDAFMGQPGFVNRVNVWHAFSWEEPIEQSLLGDYDVDGDVDGADFLSWQRRLGQAVVPAGSGADGDSSGMTDAGDLLIWADHFGGRLNVAAPGATAIQASSSSDLDEVFGAGDFTQFFLPTTSTPGGRRRFTPLRRAGY